MKMVLTVPEIELMVEGIQLILFLAKPFQSKGLLMNVFFYCSLVEYFSFFMYLNAGERLKTNNETDVPCKKIALQLITFSVFYRVQIYIYFQLCWPA